MAALIPFPVKHGLAQRLAVSRASAGLSNEQRRAGPAPLNREPVAPTRHRSCQWPMWGDDEPATGIFCGAAVIRARSYCEAHLSRVVFPITPEPPRKERPMADQRLVSIVDRLVRLEEEKRDAATAIKEVKQEAKSAGYNAAAIAVIVKQRLESDKQRAAREDREQAVDLMKAALGDLASLPLGQAAMERA